MHSVLTAVRPQGLLAMTVGCGASLSGGVTGYIAQVTRVPRHNLG